MQKYGYKYLLQKNDQILFDFGKIIVSFEFQFILLHITKGEKLSDKLYYNIF